jgi:hypothetical protein
MKKEAKKRKEKREQQGLTHIFFNSLKVESQDACLLRRERALSSFFSDLFMAKTAERRTSVHSNAVALVDQGGSVPAMGSFARSEREAEVLVPVLEGLEGLVVEDIVNRVCETSCVVILIEMVVSCAVENWQMVAGGLGRHGECSS